MPRRVPLSSKHFSAATISSVSFFGRTLLQFVMELGARRRIACNLRNGALEDVIQFEHIDARFAKNTQATADQILLDRACRCCVGWLQPGVRDADRVRKIDAAHSGLR